MTPAASAEIRTSVTELIEQHLGCAVVGLASIFEAGDKAIYRADLAGGRALVVRVFPASRPIARVRGDLAILEPAVAAGIPAERPVAGGGLADLGGRGVAITEYIAGGRPERTAADLRQLGGIAGRLSALAPDADAVAARARTELVRRMRR